MTKIRAWIIMATLLMVAFSIAHGGELVNANGAVQTSSPRDPITPELHQALNGLYSNSRLRVIVTLVSSTNLAILEKSMSNLPTERRQGEVEKALKADAETAQSALRPRLNQLQAQGQIGGLVPFWIFNGFSLSAPAAVIQELAARPEVVSIVPEKIYPAPQPVNTGTVTAVASTNPNIVLLNAPALWAKGFTGQGVVVANMDTGVDGTHPDLVSRYRGGTNSWFDPYLQNAGPTDRAGASTGHGTATMSLMVGGNASGSDIGMAPGAKWIAVKVFDNTGSATATAIHQGFQWLLDPDGNPATPDAPQVVSDSWGGINAGCDLTFQPDLQALLAAGILPVFSAGNFGPSASSDISPGNLPEAFSVGAIDNTSTIASFSSRGPTSCGRKQSTIFPLVVAPGFNVPVAAPGGLYTILSGTSFSAPETAGALALLLSAFPGLSPASQTSALINTAVDLGTAGPDNNFGYGQVDALAAYNNLVGLPTSTPTTTPPPPTATNTMAPATPTFTPTATQRPTRTSTPIPMGPNPKKVFMPMIHY